MTEQSEEFSSWLESRRLIIAQLASMNDSIKDLSAKVDRFNDGARERTDEMSGEARRAVNDLNVRLSILDMRVKMWAATIGLASGVAGEIVMQLVFKGIK